MSHSQELTDKMIDAAPDVDLAKTVEEVLTIPYASDISLRLFRRELPDLDFDGLARELNDLWQEIRARSSDEYQKAPSYSRPRLDELKHLIVHQRELAFVRKDMDMFGWGPVLRAVPEDGYKKKDIYTFHTDGGDGYRICSCYNTPTTEGIIYMPEKRIIHFRPGDIWAQACRDTDARPFEHRACDIGPGDPPRLMLVYDR